MRILLIEDEAKVASFIRRALEEESYAVDVCVDGMQGLARGGVVLRRRSGEPAGVLQGEDLVLSPATGDVTRGGRRIELTSKEYALLEYLMRNVGRVLTRPMIAEHVWNLDFDTFTNVIDVYVNYLRNKIDRGWDRKLIHTVRGTGYVLKAQ